MAEFDSTSVPGAEGPVCQVEWCGNDAILVTWESLVVLVGPFADTLQYVTAVDAQRFILNSPQVLLFWLDLCGD